MNKNYSRDLTIPRSAIATDYRRKNPQFGQVKGYVSDETKDAAAEKQMSGGWRTGRANICKVCHIAKTVTGRCEC